jgi:t-SNARE complex subunit (syntaxin)
MSDDEGSSRRKGRGGRRGRRRRNDDDGSGSEEEDVEKGDSRKSKAAEPAKPAKVEKPAEKVDKPKENGDRDRAKTSSAKPEAKVEDKRKTTVTANVNVSDPSDIGAVTRLYEPVNELIEAVKKNTGQLRKLDTGAHDEKTRAQVNKKLDALVTETTGKGIECKNQLAKLKAKNFEWKAKPGNEARENLYKKSAIDFQNVFTEYKETTEDLKKRLVDDKKRQLKTMSESVSQPLSEEKIDIIIERGQADSVIQQVMMEDNARLYDIVSDIEERHGQVLQLERQVLEVFELFKDLATLVDIQQEDLDLIDNHIQGAKQKVEKGEKELEQAREYQRKARQKKCYILMCGLAVLVFLIGGTLLGTLNRS